MSVVVVVRIASFGVIRRGEKGSRSRRKPRRRRRKISREREKADVSLIARPLDDE